MKEKKDDEKKELYLRKHGVLNPHPEKIQEELFLAHEFFDPKDLIQARYEMIRCHRIDGLTIMEVSQRFGVSRITFYNLTKRYDEEGLIGLVPRKSGPKKPHRCTKEILEFVKHRQLEEPGILCQDIIWEVRKKFNIILHRRTIERGLVRLKKKGG